MVTMIYRGLKTGKELGYYKSFPDTAFVRYRHYLVGIALEVVSLPVKAAWTIEKFLEIYYPKDQFKIVEETL